MGIRRKKSLIDQAGDYVDAVLPKIESAAATAKEKTLPLLNDARDKAAPVLAEARDKAAPIIAEGAARAADKASVGAALAAEKAAEGRDLAAAKLAQIKGEPEPKGGKVKKLLLVTGLAALGGVLFKKLRGEQTSDNWQSSYTPTPPPPAPTPASPAVVAEDAPEDSAGSAPGEAISDAADAEAEHPVTTPDDPAEVVELDENGVSKKP